MKEWMMDPVVWGAAGIIFVGFILLIVAIRWLFKPASPRGASDLDLPFNRSELDSLSVISPEPNPFTSRAPTPTPAPAPVPVSAANRDVMDKVEIISQRLVDMQMLLN